MTEYLAHSAKDTCPPQTYASHIKGVCERAIGYASEIERYAELFRGRFKEIVYQSAIWHDLGKLEEDNQKVLDGTSENVRHLPINHVDAGSAALLKKDELYSALAVYSHHRGLPNMTTEGLRGKSCFRDESRTVREHTDYILEELIARHAEAAPIPFLPQTEPYEGDQAVFLRMLLSCLADADHTDTAMSYGQIPPKDDIHKLRASERLKLLDRYVAALGTDDERSKLRCEMYAVCRDNDTEAAFTVCDSPVGSGKTTAIMAHLLKQAWVRHARRVFVVLPYTSIIRQSVEVYRKALVFPGENPEAVVAELHCRAEFQNADTRYLTALWRAPIVVTTAVAFFETLSSCFPATLRRLHELPGSVIFIDESHNAMPVKLLPLAWKWMNVLANEWSCYWVLASGSLVRFWELEKFRELSSSQPTVSELVNETLRNKLMQYEKNRIRFLWASEPKSRSELISLVTSRSGPRLIIVNTIQTAAVLAKDISVAFGRGHVEHLSTALTPEDRDATIQRVKKRLEDEKDNDWTLVATSCVEAGVDFSFRTGFRELSSLLSLIQSSGRVNRHGKYANAEVWSFALQDDAMLKNNPALETSRTILKEYFTEKSEISPKLSTQSLRDELTRDDSCIRAIEKLIDDEDCMKFKDVNDEFGVIESDTVLAVVALQFAAMLKSGECTWQQLQRKSVSIRRKKIKAWNLKEILPELYMWTAGYDRFLGYMRGVLDKNYK